ncbi:hypothetical protein PM082_015227 [Marasmius tenuissimus]|nr:hypothetical protein PM082_015227 [Marasmius tenuissimus]
MASSFHNAQNTTIGANATIQTVAGNSTITYNSYLNSGRGDQTTLYGRTVRKVIDGDIIFRRQLSSEVLSITVNSQRGVSTPSGSQVVKAKQNSILCRRLWSRVTSNFIKPRGGRLTSRVSSGSRPQVVKVKKTRQTAEIYGYSGMFTVTSLEPVDDNDRDIFEEIVKNYLEAVMSRRSALLIQVFAVAESSVLTLIAHDELANGDKFTDQYLGKELIVYYYLVYTRVCSTFELTFELPVPAEQCP